MIVPMAVGITAHQTKAREARAECDALREALNALVHAHEDLIDDYSRINKACEHAKQLLPKYDETPLHTDYGD